VLLSADTIVVKDGVVIGQPASEAEAGSIIERLARGSHRVLTGVAILTSERRRVLVDDARVRVGDIGKERIGVYIASGEWRGKAGGYNLSERLADGWPIEFEGDSGTIMGLPMQRIAPILRTLLVHGDRPASAPGPTLDPPSDSWPSEGGF
jgi:septum formation protein